MANQIERGQHKAELFIQLYRSEIDPLEYVPPIALLSDIDGVLVFGPIPSKTTWALLRRKFYISPVEEELYPFKIPEHGLKKWFRALNKVLHEIRPYKRESLEGLAIFAAVATNYNHPIFEAALSGRETDLHQMTEQKLQKWGHMKYFQDLYLNTTTSSSGSKKARARELVNLGYTVIDIDDDLKAALNIAQIAQEEGNENKVLVYLMQNLSNSPWLLERAGVLLPDNVVRVGSFWEAAMDFDERLRTFKIG